MDGLKQRGAASLVLLAALLVPLLTASRGNPHLPVILRAEADLDTGSLAIWGEDFGTTTQSVQLGGTTLDVRSWTPGEIVAQLPADITPGTYLLRVFAAKGSGFVDMAVTLSGQPAANRWVAGSVHGTPTSLLNLSMPGLVGANSTNTVVLASGSKRLLGVVTPIAALGTVVDESHVSFEVWDVDGEGYDPAVWDGLDIRYAVFLVE